MKLDSKGILSGANVVQKPSSHFGGDVNVRVWVNHWTAGASALNSATGLESKGLSANIVLDRDGTVFQTVRFGKRAFHAGKSAWRGIKSVNDFSIGNEIANYGPLVKDSSGNYRLPGSGALIVPVEEADERVDLGPALNGSQEFVAWERFTPLQIEATAEMIHLAHKKFDIEEVVTHAEVSPGRKIDILNPGWLLFAQRFDAIVENVSGGDTKDPALRQDVYRVTARSGLRLRSGPGTDFDQIDSLPFGTEVVGGEHIGDWIAIDRKGDGGVDGFSFASFLQLV